MATPSWKVTGQYHETCSCDFVCPCILGQMAVCPTKGCVHLRDGVQKSIAASSAMCRSMASGSSCSD